MRRGHNRPRLWRQVVLELLVCLAAFSLPAIVLGFTDLDRVGLTVAMGTLFWLGAQVQGSPNSERSAWVVAIERTWVGAGLNLILLAALAHFYVVEPAAFLLVILGSVVAGIVTGLVSARASRKESGPVLLLGGAPLGASLVGELHVDSRGQAVIAVSDFDGLAGAVAAQRPAHIVVSLPDTGTLTMSEKLLEYRAAGIQVDHMADLYERLYLRVCTEGLPPSELLSSTAFTASRPIMSLQATYSNLLGLALLIGLFPLMAVLSVVSGLAAGGGPFLERMECAGFQAIPFQRMRFRTRHVVRGHLTWIGRIIDWFGLTGLPQVINIVRGEMAMFGPAPVRKDFADALIKRIPLYARRFSTRPGLLGWAQVHMARGIPEATVQLEYDLYYIKECSPSLDFEILLRALLRTRRGPSSKR